MEEQENDVLNLLMKKKKEESKRQLEVQLKEWINNTTIDHIVLSQDMSSITEINSKPVSVYNMVYLRSLCIKLKINGYKNKRRDEMLTMLCERKRIQIVVESAQYCGDEDESPDAAAAGRTNKADMTADDSSPADTSMATQTPSPHSCNSGTSTSTPIVCRTSTTPTDTTNSPFSSPETRSMSRARLQAEAQQTMAAGAAARVVSSKKPKASTKVAKGTAPTAVTKEGTYYRAINVWFDERNRTEIMNMGKSPSMQELDSRQFLNKRTYDKLLMSFLDTSMDNDAINFIGFGSDEFLLSSGIREDQASSFDTLTSIELKQVLEYIVHWYNVSLRNNRASGNHADFHQYVGCRPYVYYYHRWLEEIPHLSFLAVPSLDDNVFQLSMEQNDEEPSSTTSASSEQLSTKRKRGGDDNSGKKQKSTNKKLSVEMMSNQMKEQEEKKLKVFESHLKAMEGIEKERALKRAERDKQASQLSRSSELKTIEEMLQMKRSELKEYESLDPERKVAEKQLKKLRRRRDQLMESVCAFHDDDDSSSSSTSL
jgi:hypothetical protein